QYAPAWSKVAGDSELAERRRLINPMGYLDHLDASKPAAYYRINVGAQDADTAFTISMALAVKLANLGKDVEYNLVWDKPPCEA
ncbi:MAG: hypothetical protein LUC27_03705, partial [Lachnospiraceae bacterium]|nr:hypothetical protein [Lachnospiraceae bacterium]